MSVRVLALALVTALGTAHAASRAPCGGTLQVWLLGPPVGDDPLLEDSPERQALVAARSLPWCRQVDGQAVPVASRSADPRVRQALGEAWERALAPGSPYRTLLWPLAQDPASLEARLAPGAGPLTAAFPFPDLAASLCHPALAIPATRGLGPFVQEGARLHANLQFPLGRPYFDLLAVSAGTEEVAWRRRAADLRLGDPRENDPSPVPTLEATYLLYRPERAGGFGPSIAAALDVEALTRIFIRAPSRPLHGLLPQSAGPRPTGPALTGGPPGPVELAYDQGSASQRAAAERLQVKARALGYGVVLQPQPERVLRQRRVSGQFQAMLQSVLLPPAPAPALGVVLDLAAVPQEAILAELKALGAQPDPQVRAAAALERAAQWASRLSIVPLFSEGAAVGHGPQVAGLQCDDYGVPLLDGLFRAPSPQAQE